MITLYKGKAWAACESHTLTWRLTLYISKITCSRRNMEHIWIYLYQLKSCQSVCCFTLKALQSEFCLCRRSGCAYNMHHCVRSVSFGSRVLLIFILFYTLPLLETPAADINGRRQCLGLTSKCITSTNFQIFEEISPCKDDSFKFVSFNFSVDICINYSQKKQTSHPRDLHLIQSLGQR